MLKKLLFGAGAAYLARKFIGRRRPMTATPGSGLGLGRSRWGRRGTSW